MWATPGLETENKMERREINIFTDLLIFFDLVLVILTGLILKFRLPPGTGGGRRRIYGSGGDSLFAFWGLTRHEWGGVHFYLALALIGLAAIHLYLHWSWIRQVFSNPGSDGG